VLRTHDFIEEPGWAAISFDHTEAESLSTLMAKRENGCFNAGDIQPWMTVICQTMDDAHRSNLLHRDLSPSNFLVAKAGGIMVANFGISRIILDAVSRMQGPAAKDEHLAFMSPQQLDGEHPARWDDVYGLGALVYTLLTGKPPFQGEDALAQIRKAVPSSIAERRSELGITGEPIPENWEKVVAACLSKHTPQRPKSARDRSQLRRLQNRKNQPNPRQTKRSRNNGPRTNWVKSSGEPTNRRPGRSRIPPHPLRICWKSFPMNRQGRKSRRNLRLESWQSPAQRCWLPC
jgi:serine/threonine protein kinase